MKKRIVLCADDYGQAPNISKAILTLANNQRLSATSCMVNTAYWREHAHWLEPLVQKMDIGLHFNLTQGAALSKKYVKAYGKYFPGLTRILARSLARQLDLNVIIDELNAQLDRFSDHMGILPSHIDGHQHIHQFPVIRQAILQVYRDRLATNQSYIRLVNEKFSPATLLNPKKIIIYRLGGVGMQMLLQEYDVPHNGSFAGIYGFQAANYRRYFQKFLHSVQASGLIMCHPGEDRKVQGDPILAARIGELAYLSGSDFLQDCASAKVEIGRFWSN